jgi:2-methylcitrate dehydratase PrpD
MTSKGTTRDIAEFALKTSYDDFDEKLRQRTKEILLDSVGMTLPGAKMAQGIAAINYIKEQRAPEEAGVWGAGFRTSAEWAAAANGCSSHTTELEDDTYPDGTYQVGIFPGIFALGEKLHISGKQAMEGFVIAFDVAAKLGLASLEAMTRGFCGPALHSTIGVAASAAKMLKLDLEKTINAVSISASQASGLVKQTGSGIHLYEAGKSSKDGISSAMLAKHGLTGLPNIIEMPMGYMDSIAGVTDPDLKLGVGGFHSVNIGIKRYPCCFMQQQCMFGFQELIMENNISADDVESIEVDVQPGFMIPVRFQSPENEDQARFSLPHSLAVLLLDKDKKVFLDSYSEAKVHDPRVKALRDKVKLIVHPEWMLPGISGHDNPVKIRLKDGREFSKVCTSADVSMILDVNEVLEKYMDCALRVVSKSRADEIADLVLNLEKVDDIGKISELATYPDK